MGRFLVLGGDWVGSAVARSARRGHEVIVIDPPFVPELAPRDDAATEAMARIVSEERIDAVVNACGRTRGSRDDLEDANVEFPRWLCTVLSGTGVRLVHVGSASEFGDPGSAAPVTEDVTCDPRGDYAITKWRGTETVLAARSKGLDAVVARVFNIAGRPVPAISPIHQWLTDLGALGPRGGELDVWWPPTTRDFVTLDDAAAALVDLGTDGPRPELVNVCSGVPLAYGDIVGALASSMGITVTVRSLERPGIESVVGDTKLLRRTLGWVPQMSLERLASAVVTGGDTQANP